MASGAQSGRGFDFLMKLVLIGDSAVGKSCLLMRFAEQTYSDTLMTTIGIDFKTKMVELDKSIIKLQVWDTAGQERFESLSAGGLTRAYYRGAMGIILVYDITDARSLNNIRNWMRNIESNAEDHVDKVLVGNKSDMETEREVDTEKGQALADQYGIPFFETSAKDDVLVTEAFLELAKIVKKRLMKTESRQAASAPDDGTIKLGGGNQKKVKGQCCK
eukprot:gb/GEZN01014617.1/.p1 GENE.gb/GEZN01014617.1/~~gb/GEZN01014617.1/.p1  ORF type:complete len:218 (-),score=32.71 gb/GEZN01014617.1/:176-829(-)